MRNLLIIAMMLTAGAAFAQDAPDRIVIPHGTHFENDVTCLDCHDGVDGSQAADEIFRPDMDVCGDCHEVDDDETCDMCHTNVDEAGDYPGLAYGAARFPHAPHVARGMECTDCHGDPALDTPLLPGKPECRACHETADDYGDCRTCHAPAFELKPAGHDLAWVNEHGGLAREDQALCAQCHTETSCQECHAGDNVRPRSHTLNYEWDHAIDARSSAMECATCHLDPQYCTSCHAVSRVLPRSHSQAGWLNGTDGGQHALDGVFEMENCVACHSAGAESPSCAQCHGG